MKYLLLFCLVTSLAVKAQQVKTVSPDGAIQLSVILNQNGNITYSLNYKSRPVILQSTLGMKFKEPAVNLQQFKLLKIDSSAYDETWNTVWGEYRSIRDHHKELVFHLEEKNGSGTN